jgi:hypothetical protein
MNLLRKWFAPRIWPNPRYIQAPYELWVFCTKHPAKFDWCVAWVRHGEPASRQTALEALRRLGFYPVDEGLRYRADADGNRVMPCVKMSKVRYRLLGLILTARNVFHANGSPNKPVLKQ